jgi:hypothetical protein
LAQTGGDARGRGGSVRPEADRASHSFRDHPVADFVDVERIGKKGSHPFRRKPS